VDRTATTALHDQPGLKKAKVTLLEAVRISEPLKAYIGDGENQGMSGANQVDRTGRILGPTFQETSREVAGQLKEGVSKTERSPLRKGERKGNYLEKEKIDPGGPGRTGFNIGNSLHLRKGR